MLEYRYRGLRHTQNSHALALDSGSFPSKIPSANMKKDSKRLAGWICKRASG